MADTTKKNEELRKVNRILETLQKIIINRLTRAENQDEFEKQAIIIKKKLTTIANEYGGGKCKEGEIRNPDTGKCEPV